MADVLFGDVNPSGKLPVTFYKSSSQLPDYEDYSMKGRTYRYFNDALFPFGYGLSYTEFKVESGRWKENANGNGDGIVTVDVTNTGARKGAEVVQLYIRNLQDTEGPLKSLRGFQRVTLNPGQTQTIAIPLSRQSFEFRDPETNTMRVKPGRYEILIGNSSQDKNMKKQIVNL